MDEMIKFYPTVWNPDKPLDKIEGENAKQNKALLDLAELGDGASIAQLWGVYKNSDEPVPTNQMTTLKNWSRKHHWQARLAAYNSVLMSQREAEREVLRAQRRAELEDRDYQDGQRLRTICNVLMQKLIVHLEGADWGQTGVTLAQLKEGLRVASELQRLSTNEPTQLINLTGQALDDAIERELARELEALINQGQTALPPEITTSE